MSVMQLVGEPCNQIFKSGPVNWYKQSKMSNRQLQETREKVFLSIFEVQNCVL